MIVSAEKIKNETVVFIDPPDGRVEALAKMKRPENKKEIQILCGCISALQSWFPSVSYQIPNLRKACAGNRQFEWSTLLENNTRGSKIFSKRKLDYRLMTHQNH